MGGGLLLGILALWGACIAFCGIVLVATWWRARTPLGEREARIGLQLVMFGSAMAAMPIGCIALEHAHMGLRASRTEPLIDRIEDFHRAQGAYPASLAELAAADGQRIPVDIADHDYYARSDGFDIRISGGFMDALVYDSRSGAWVEN